MNQLPLIDTRQVSPAFSAFTWTCFLGGGPEGKERSDAVMSFRSVSGEKWLRSRHDSRLCRAHIAKRSVTVAIMPFVVFASDKGIVDAKHEQTPMDSALAPVEKEGESG